MSNGETWVRRRPRSPAMKIMPEGLRDVLDWVKSREHEPSRCYRCWQVQEYVTKQRRATCVVLHNPDTDHEWKCVSCDECAARDCAYEPRVPASRVIARLLPGGTR